ncbi:MAG: nitroreductase family protein [Leptospiraceae bacterium]|nr:nitroreductase family protein [Leptospiraceae bacterium]
MNQISRKNFLMKTGVILTVPMFLKYCATTVYPRLTGKSGFDPIDNALAEEVQYPILKAINVGITAPNPHNTQAWKFKITSPLEMILYVDEKRILPITDPPARQIHIGQGCFLELLKIGAKQIGYDAEIKILPDGEYKFEEIGKKPVAKVKLTPSKSTGHTLYEFVKQRATNRAVYTGEYITDEEFSKLKKMGGSENSELEIVSGASGIEPFKKVFFEAMKIESTTFRTGEESRVWFRFNDKEIQTKRDGIALPDQGLSGFTRWMAETFFMGPEQEKFHDKKGLEIFLSRYKEKIDSTKGIVFWKTKTNTQKDWIQTGMDYARFHLAVTSLGLKMHPFSQALQEFPEMEQERRKLESLTGVNGKEKVQMIVRLGRTDYRYFTPRRNFKDMIMK